MRARLACALWLAALVAGGCGKRRLGPVDADGGGAAGADASSTGAAGAQAPAGADGGAAEAGASSPMRAFADFVDDRDAALRARFAECFGARADLPVHWLYDDDPGSYADELEKGLVTVDPAGRTACLAAIRGASCAALAARASDAACAGALVGHVARGGVCIRNEDCADRGDVCKNDGGPCGSRCEARARMPARLGEGSSCTSVEACATGLYCRWAGPSTQGLLGLCSAIAEGGTCDGGWQCAFPYTCVFAQDAARGTCRAGRRVGEACRLYAADADNGPYSECAISLACYPDANGDLRCGEGAADGQVCGDVPLPGQGNDGFLPCRTGWCKHDVSPQRCVPHKKEGETCAIDGECADRLTCFQEVCMPRSEVGVPAGAECAVLSDPCKRGTFCDLDRNDSDGVGMCRAFLEVGQACVVPWSCSLGATCVAGICTRC